MRKSNCRGRSSIPCSTTGQRTASPNRMSQALGARHQRSIWSTGWTANGGVRDGYYCVGALPTQAGGPPARSAGREPTTMIVTLPATSTTEVNKKIIGLREEGGAITMGRVLTLVIAPDTENIRAYSDG